MLYHSTFSFVTYPCHRRLSARPNYPTLLVLNQAVLPYGNIAPQISYTPSRIYIRFKMYSCSEGTGTINLELRHYDFGPGVTT